MPLTLCLLSLRCVPPEHAGQATGIHVFSQGNSLCRTVLYHCLPYFRKRYRERYRKLIYLFYRLFLRLSIVAIQYTILNCILSFTLRNSRIPSKKNDRFAIGSGRFIERVDLYFVSSGTGKCDPLLRSCRGGMSSEQTVPEQQERQKPQYDPRSCSNCGIAFRILPQQTIRQCQNTRAKQQIQPAFLLKQHAEFCIWEQQFIEQSEQTEQQQCFHQNASEHAPNWRESRADQAKRPNRALPPPMHQAGSSTSARTTCGKFQSQSRRRSAQESVVGSSSRSTSNEPVFPCSTQPVSALLCPIAQCSAGASAARSSPAAASDRPTTTPAAFAASFRLETRFTRIMLSLAALRTSWR